MDKNEFISYLNSLLEKFDISLTENQEYQFYVYYNMLVEKNKVMNLTNITEPKDVALKHFADSISLIHYFDFSKIESIIDVGTGAGFPGIPLKIMFPEKKILLLDSLNKRIKFLNEVIDSLCLENIETVHSRAEDAAHNKLYREKFDLCVSRAVANLSTLSEYCLPFVRKNGYFVSYKSVELTNEAISAENALKILGGSKPECIYFDLDDYDYHRSFAIIHKLDNTKKKYPRKAGTPSKEPL
jgi:16S rRNA (guanine527-N7)-methyltransferase